MVLDLGCGSGKTLSHLGVDESTEIISCDPLPLFQSANRFPKRRFVQAVGESLPFRTESFESVLCLLSLPYMDIPVALKEAHRVLQPGGKLFVSLHPLNFTLDELRQSHTLKAIAYRLFVILNGVYFHCTGKVLGLGVGRCESFQTLRGISKALKAAGFVGLSVSRPNGDTGKRLLVTAEKPGSLWPSLCHTHSETLSV